MRKQLLVTIIILAGICSTATAQEKVVVIPLPYTKVAGENSQLQYNDNGKNAGAEVYYNKASGKIGIGEMNPTEFLDVNGNVRANTFIGDGGSLTGVVVTESDPTVPVNVKDGISWTEVSSRPAGLDDGDDVGLTIESDPQVGTISTNYVPRWNGSNLVTGSIYDNGNIGIGTPSPSTPLTIKASRAGSGSAVHGLRWEDSGSSDGWNLYMSTANEMYLAYNGSLRLYLHPTAATNWNVFSDKRLKKDIEQLHYGLNTILALNPVTFHYKDQPNTDANNIGFIAQNVEELMPELVSTTAEGYKGLDYGSFTPVLTKAIHEQQIQIKDLEAENKSLQKEIAAMKELVCLDHLDSAICN